ncbi:putative transcriptional adapter 2 protein [Zalerion maritima]|uniref:Transcriptional adapter 2 n=1 Tax=Zalerion maritima TaxID=339359 RepID=A0AAD5RYL9_9PEZI|nr:putative transcriptional adapter 2 protein [Zalerion maritima]
MRPVKPSRILHLGPRFRSGVGTNMAFHTLAAELSQDSTHTLNTLQISSQLLGFCSFGTLPCCLLDLSSKFCSNPTTIHSNNSFFYPPLAPCGYIPTTVLTTSALLASNSHQPSTHPYQVIEQNSFPIFHEEWGADEELLLIEGCETYGLGSWADIADHIGGFRSKDEVRDHYLKTYVESPAFPLPKRCSPNDMELANNIGREEFQARKKRRIEERKEEAKNAPALQPKTKPTASVPSCHEIQGYMPGRLEFETEHANEAEEAVQLMQFDPGDGISPRTGELEPEMELKLTVMDIYNARLTQRVERKKVIFEHNLLDYRENMRLEKKRTKEEKDLLNKAKPFARMMNHDDFEAFCKGLVDEINLRQAITQLQDWRRMRIGDLRSGEKYETDKAQRVQKNLGSMDRERLAANQRNKAKDQQEAPSQASLLVAPELPPDFHPAEPEVKNESKNSQHRTDGQTNGILTNGNANGTNGVLPSRHKYVPQAISGVPPMVFTQENAPDLHLLTLEEQKLCEVCRIQPKPYLMIKEQITKIAGASAGMLKKKQVKEICRLETQKGGRIFDFFVHAGWIGKA